MSYSDPISQKQLEYIYILIKEGWIDKSDFASSKDYYRKKNMCRYTGNELIKLGCYRREKWWNSPSY